MEENTFKISILLLGGFIILVGLLAISIWGVPKEFVM